MKACVEHERVRDADSRSVRPARAASMTNASSVRSDRPRRADIHVNAATCHRRRTKRRQDDETFRMRVMRLFKSACDRNMQSHLRGQGVPLKTLPPPRLELESRSRQPALTVRRPPPGLRAAPQRRAAPARPSERHAPGSLPALAPARSRARHPPLCGAQTQPPAPPPAPDNEGRRARGGSPALTPAACLAGTMSSQDIEYSEKYFDDDFEYRSAQQEPIQPAPLAPALRARAAPRPTPRPPAGTLSCRSTSPSRRRRGGCYRRRSGVASVCSRAAAGCTMQSTGTLPTAPRPSPAPQGARRHAA